VTEAEADAGDITETASCRTNTNMTLEINLKFTLNYHMNGERWSISVLVYLNVSYLRSIHFDSIIFFVFIDIIF
jgi:hypothetical protein